MSKLTGDEKRQRGRALYADMLGTEKLARVDASRSAFNEPILDHVMENCFGDVWQRPGLPRKTRSMLCIAMLTALRMPHEVKNHIRSALANGCTVDEIREVIFHTVPYCGMPAMGLTLAAAEEVLRERGLIPTGTHEDRKTE